jgi:hypothetical protein
MFGGGLEQVMRTSELMDHFEEHRTRDANITVLDFVIMHSADQQHGRSEPERHAQLPFGTHHSLHQIMLPDTPEHRVDAFPASVPIPTAGDVSLPNVLHVCGVFHPPKSIE